MYPPYCALFPFFFFNDTATTEIYTLSLHDALPISTGSPAILAVAAILHRLASGSFILAGDGIAGVRDRKSTRLNSSHGYISYAVFCLKKKGGLFGVSEDFGTDFQNGAESGVLAYRA